MSLRQLRQQSLFDGYDQLTPGAGQQQEYSDDDYNPSSPYTPGPTSSGLESVGAQQDRDAVLGPDGRPLDDSNIKAPTIDPVGTPSPSKGASFEDYIDMMNKGYTPDYTSRDRLNKLLDEAPTRSAPGWGRALIAAGMSVKADDPIATAEKVMYAPYMRDVEEWKTRADPYYKAADLENRQNINERTLMTNAATAYSAAERTAAQERAAADRNEVSMINARANQARSLGYKVAVVGTRLVGTRTVDGKIEKVDLGDSGKMDERDRVLLQNEGRVAAAEASAGGALGRVQAGGGGIHQTPDGRTWRLDENGNPVEVQYPPRGGGPPASTSGRVTKPSSSVGGDSALERKRVEQERIADVRETDPGARKQLIPSGNGTYTMRPRPVPHEDTWVPGDHVPQEDADEWDRVKKLIDPTYEPPPPTIPRVGASGIGPSTPAGTSNKVKTSPIGGSNTPPVSAGRVTVTDHDGNKTTIRNNPAEIERYRGLGYKVDAPESVPQGPIPPKKSDAPLAGIPQGRIPVYGKNGAIVGHIPNTPEQRAAAKAQGYTVK